MTNHAYSFLCVVAVGSIGSCSPTPSKTDHDLAAESVTEDFVAIYVRPLADPVAKAAHDPTTLPQALLTANRVIAIEVIPRSLQVIPKAIRHFGPTQPTTVYDGSIARPPNSGMVTGVPNAEKIGLYYPKSLDQPEVEVRMNYSCDACGHIAVHLIVPNPLVIATKHPK